MVLVVGHEHRSDLWVKIDLIVFGVDYIKWATIPGALATKPSIIYLIDNLAIGTFEFDPPAIWKVDNFERAIGVRFGFTEGKGIVGVDRQVITVFVSKGDELG